MWRGRYLANGVEQSSSFFLSLYLKDPDWVPGLRIAAGVITNRGGRTCHAAIVSRELGVPCIVGTKDATEKLQTGDTYTIDCSNGSTGLV